jgi:hypothetical protein
MSTWSVPARWTRHGVRAQLPPALTSAAHPLAPAPARPLGNRVKRVDRPELHCAAPTGRPEAPPARSLQPARRLRPGPLRRPPRPPRRRPLRLRRPLPRQVSRRLRLPRLSRRPRCPRCPRSSRHLRRRSGSRRHPRCPRCRRSYRRFRLCHRCRRSTRRSCRICLFRRTSRSGVQAPMVVVSVRGADVSP